MSFIRIKGKDSDSVFEVVEEDNTTYRVKARGNPHHIYGKSKSWTEVVAKADTIDKLCDEFVFEDSDGHYLCDFCEQTDIDVGSKFGELKYWFNHSKEQQYKTRNCYGAIWTDKGLIYVAKMNEKGELELI